ncbi:hypothetical protein NC653_004883 [Populus alba x Populus x berolinensis]|uniref:Protein NO VEIN C-terminal domain-containing protein n=1 Tax=Populus alba x Populus x berolinensis TaxID=444605 RepID=A0AAD6RVG9_9ROSI|nr:hypothetical protein NC653_004883 [Populus alba x Populus x berolinensis]
MENACKYLLEVLDTLWDDNFSDKATIYYDLKSSDNGRSFKSSFISKICDFQWVVSCMDNELHYPKDLFYDCDAVRSILGASAPYALPKTEVTIDDVLEIIKAWRKSETTFKARNKVSEAFRSGPFIFVPSKSGSNHKDLLPGVFLSAEDVYWHDPTGSMDRLEKDPFSGRVNKCYSVPVKQDILSTAVLPSQAASAVFKVLLMWTEGLESGSLSTEEIIHLKECLTKLDYTVLPTAQDKWVSLDPSFGLVCWSDDKNLRKIFKNFNNIEFLYFGNLSGSEQEMLQTKVSLLLQKLGIPALSEDSLRNTLTNFYVIAQNVLFKVFPFLQTSCMHIMVVFTRFVTRKAIYDGPADSSFKASLINWALPYAQRYIYSTHPDKYSKLKQSGFNHLKQLQVIAVEKLSFHYAIKKCHLASKRQEQCSCLLEGNTLYTRLESDTHALFLELSRLFFDGTPELHLANFLHMITTMAESGSTEEQTEFFIVNSQKKPSNLKLKASVSSYWPPADWKTAPDFHSSRCSINDEEIVTEAVSVVPAKNNADFTIENKADELPESDNVDTQSPNFNGPELGPSKIFRTDQLRPGTANAIQAMATGREGEQVAFNHLTQKFGQVVKWVNQDNETGLPYDMVIEVGSSKEYIEVKATRSSMKNWFEISFREWHFAVEKGECFSILHVLLDFFRKRRNALTREFRGITTSMPGCRNSVAFEFQAKRFDSVSGGIPTRCPGCRNSVAFEFRVIPLEHVCFCYLFYIRLLPQRRNA